MNIMTRANSLVLWEEVVKEAEKDCAVKLEHELEAYLTSLLFHYTDKPAALSGVLATSFLKALQSTPHQRDYSLQQVGDQCLLLTGLFPRAANRRCVRIRYFVDLGQTAYSAISKANGLNGLYRDLSVQFVLLMDILQSIRQFPDLLPLEAYEQWHELGSQRAYRLLQSYTAGIPFKMNRSPLK